MKRKLSSYCFLIALPLLFLSGCAGLADYDVDLHGDYSIVRTSAHSVFIAPKNRDTGGWGSPVIPMKVTEVTWDESYIIAKQVDLKEDPSQSNGYQVPDEQIYHFWLLDFKTGKIIGPLDDEGLTAKRKEFNIADNIILQDIEDLR